MAFWMTLGRSLLAITLGVAILFYPDKAKPLLGNFIGGFWIAGSLISIRWGLANERSRALTLVIGVIGAIAGLAVVGRSLVDRWLVEDAMDLILGIVAVLTGMLHMTGHLQVKKFTDRSQTRSGVILGLFEVVLGLIILFTPWRELTLINYVVIAWALIGGVILFAEALAMRREAKEIEAKETEITV